MLCIKNPLTRTFTGWPGCMGVTVSCDKHYSLSRELLEHLSLDETWHAAAQHGSLCKQVVNSSA